MVHALCFMIVISMSHGRRQNDATMIEEGIYRTATSIDEYTRRVTEALNRPDVPIR